MSTERVDDRQGRPAAGRWGLSGAAALAVLLSIAAVYWQARPAFTVRVDGEARTVRAHAGTVEAVLRAAGLAWRPEDGVWLGDDQVQTQVSDPATPIQPDALVVVERAQPLRLEADGAVVTLLARPAVPAALLSQGGLLLGPGDEVWADGVRVDAEQALAGWPAQLAVRRAVPVTIVDGERTFTLQTAARTVGEALWQAGLRLYEADGVEPELAAPLAAGVTIRLSRAQLITVQADGRTLAGRAQAATVGEALAALGMPLAGADYAVPAAAGPLPADGLVRVVRVREEVLAEQTVIPRETVYQALPEVDIDTVQTLQAGADGLRRRYVRVRYEDGREVSRVTEGESLAQAPAPRVIGYGTKITVRVLDTPDGPLEYWRAYTVYATSYSASRAGVPRTARNFGITASGRPLTKGLIAVDRRYIPFNTRMYVPGYGFALAADTGGGVKGRFIDLGYDDWNYAHWSQVVTVYFLTPIPPADQIAWIIPSTVP
ncbi:MAG: DUF348 domain-containing protein [Anaerolineales bacterium]|nr:DUF348 domain-containing protein [Anaerolineales bacterium]